MQSMTPSRRRFLGQSLGLGLALSSPLAWAQSAAAAWPAADATLNWVVPYPAGGSVDTVGRNMAQQMTEALGGAKVIVHNKAGATGTMGAAFVAKARADGLTLLGTSIGPSAIAPHLMKLPYDPFAALAPVITIGELAHVLVVGKKRPWRSVAELLAAARAKGAQLAYGSGGTGTILHMQGELLAQSQNLTLIHAPYQGEAPALQDLIGGQLDFMFVPTAAALPHIRAGNLHALAVTADKRLATLPDVPTMAEAGVADFVVTQWQAVFVPAGTPAERIATLNRVMAAALQTPAMRELAERSGFTLVGGTSEDLARRHRADYERWGTVIRRAGITAQ